MQPGSNQCRALPRRLTVSFLSLCLFCAAIQAQPGNGTPDKIGPPTPIASTPPIKGLEGLKLPPDAIIVVVEQAADALRQLPRFVVLSPERLKELQDEIEKLKAKPRPEKPCLPSIVHIEGKVEGEVAHLDVRYDFETDRPGSLLALGCKQATPTRVTLEGGTPLVRFIDGEGWAAHIANKGKSQLTAHYSLALTTPGPVSPLRTLDLDLPAAAGTTIKLQIGAVKDLRVNDRPLDNPLLTWHGGVLEGSYNPGPSNKLTVSWKGSSSAPGGTPVLIAEGAIRARVDEQRQLRTSAVLQLKVQGGQTGVWKLLVPLQARLRLVPGDEERITIETQDFPTASVRTLRLKEPSTEPLTVTVEAPTRPLTPRPGIRVPIGPFALLGATRQTGTGRVSSAMANLQFQLHLPASGGVSLQPPPIDEKPGGQVQAFSYELPTMGENPPFVDKAASLALLELECELVQGRLEANQAHLFRLSHKGNPGGRHWTVQTTIEARLLQAGVEQLIWQLPPDWVFVPGEQRPSDAVLDVIRHDEERRVVLRLAGEGWKTFTATLRARCNRPVGDQGTESLSLPKLLGAIPAGFKVSVVVPEELELLPPRELTPLLELSQTSPQEQVWRPDIAADGPAEQVEVSWRPFRPHVHVDSVVDLTFSGGTGQVRQELRFSGEPARTGSPRVPARVILRVPAEVDPQGDITLVGEDSGGSSVRHVAITTPSGNEPLVLKYSVKLSDNRDSLNIPLISVESATHADTKVRVFAESGRVPCLANAEGWSVGRIEEVKDQPRYPSLVVHSRQVEPQLRLRFTDPSESPATTVFVERALVRVDVFENVGQHYTVRFRISRLPKEGLEVELPAPVAGLNLQIKLLHHKDPDYKFTADSPIIRVTFPPLNEANSILEIKYQLPPSGLDNPARRLLQTVLQPPVLRGAPSRILTRWEVRLPSGWVVLGPEGGPGSERVWSRRGWLLTPRLKLTSADLDRWLLGDPGISAMPEEGEAVVVPSLVCWRGSLEPMTVVHAPQQAWLLICSLLVLVFGLGIWLLCRTEDGKGNLRLGRVWLAASVIALILVGASVFWPTVMVAVAYGCQPGLVVLLAVWALQAMLHERRRRQLVFLPSFTRNRGSSLLRNKPASNRPRPHGEPSTVDAPRQI